MPCSLLPAPHAVAEASMGQRGEFGAAVAAVRDPSRGGAFCAVGAPNAMSSGNPRGSVSLTVFDGQDGTMRPCSRIGRGTLAPAGLSAHARFGAALDVAQNESDEGVGRLLAVGAPGADSAGGSRAGLVRLYRIGWVMDGGPIPLTELLDFSPAAGSDGAAFGASVALRADGLQLAIGAPFASDEGGPSFAGAVYVYGAEDGEWTLQFALAPPRPSVAATFGHALAWVGGTLVVGAPGDGEVAPGAGRVYGIVGEGPERGTFSWEVAAPAKASAAAGMRFGESLAAVGPGAVAVSGFGRGVVEVLAVPSSGEPIHQTLLQGNPAEGFGLGLAATEGRLLVAAPFAQGPGGESSAGRVDTFARRGDAWVLERADYSAHPSASGEFGVALDAFTAASGSTHVLVGEPGSHAACPRASNCAAGAAFLF